MKKFSALYFLLFCIINATAQSFSNFCSDLKTICDDIQYGKKNNWGEQVKKDDFFTEYRSKLKLSSTGRAVFRQSNKDQYFKSYTEWIGEQVTLEKAKQIYSEYFAKLKTCYGGELKETIYNSETKWATYFGYSASYEVQLKFTNYSNTGTYLVYISVSPIEDYDY